MDHYINRELSWLKFNERVLDEALKDGNPLFERLKFLAITAGNLDEFTMVRMASLYEMKKSGAESEDICGKSASSQIDEISPEIKAFVKKQYRIYNRTLSPLLRENGIYLLRKEQELTVSDKNYIDEYFDEEIYPVLTPMAVDSSRPFPLLHNKALYIGSLVKKKKKDELVDFCLVQVPDVLPRIIELPHESPEACRLVLLEDVIERNLRKLFFNYDIICSHSFRLIRSADFSIDEYEISDLLSEIEKQLKKRRWGMALRLEISGGADTELTDRLAEELRIDHPNIYRLDGPIDLSFLDKICDFKESADLRENRYKSGITPKYFQEDASVFDVIKKKDVLLHHPYESFEPVVRFIEEAARDKNVLAIKQTLYRVSPGSPIIAALARAADSGKQVSVLVELKARFDEENNIGWARMLEKAGCHVIYGLVGLKTHCKITLVVRREEDGIRRYVHLGTGNYNELTARLYSDVGMFTCKEAYGADATAVFNMLSGYSEPPVWNKLVIAPLWLKDRIIYLINREADHAKKGEPARIIAKMNSLCHKEVIDALYAAAKSGVEIDLIVRGICSLRTDLEELNGRIRVRSIVGNFLEHSRIFYFKNGFLPELYCASADWMKRNLERRVEIMFPVEDEELKEKLIHILEIELKDTEQARIMQENGKYADVDKRGKRHINSQLILGKEIHAENNKQTSQKTRVFVPRTSESNI